MDTIISFLEKLVHYSAELGIVLAELAGIAILIITAMKGVVSYFKHDEHLRLELAQGIALALEFKLGGEVLRTVIVREWTELLILGAVIALRGVLTLLLHWEIKVEEEHDERLLKLKAMEDMKQGLLVLLAKGSCKNITREEVHQLIDEIYEEYGA